MMKQANELSAQLMVLPPQTDLGAMPGTSISLQSAALVADPGQQTVSIAGNPGIYSDTPVLIDGCWTVVT